MALALALGLRLEAQTKAYTISGHVYDKQSRETLIGATVYVPELKTGVYTNAYGFFSISLTHPVKVLRISYVGYGAREIPLYPDSLSTSLTVELEPTQLQEVVITSDRRQLHQPIAGALEVPIHIVKSTPSLLGESDLMKSLQMMPGVKGGTDGSAGVHVRGGGVDENLILLDGVPVYNVDHLLGFFSVFTPEAVKKVDLYKGSFPARFGGRLSSVIDVRTNDGNMQKLRGAIGVGLLSAKLHVEGPIVKDKTSFTASLRRSYFDLLMQPFLPRESKGGYYFYDFNAKVQHRFSSRDRVSISFYRGLDKLHALNRDATSEGNTQMKGNLNWGNLLATLRWNHVFSPKLYSDLTLSYTQYHFEIATENKQYKGGVLSEGIGSEYNSGIQDFAANWNLQYSHSPKLELRFGADFIRHRFRPEAYNYAISGEGIAPKSHKIGQRSIYANDLAGYTELKWQLNSSLLLNAGVRGTLFSVEGTSYLSLEPRADLDIRLSDRLSTQLSYARMSQNIHLLTSATMTLPTDLWVSSTAKIKPMSSEQFSVVAKYELAPGWSLGADLYYKRMNNVLEYQDGATFVGSSAGWEDKVVAGKGRAYGLELMLMKQTGTTTGWIGYTLSRSERRFEDGSINHGKWFPYKYDRTHHVNIMLTHKLSKRWDVSASWEFYTGGVITLATEIQEIITPSGIGRAQYISARNNYRLDNTHRLNLSFNYTKKLSRGRQKTWNFSLFNAYNAKNPSFVLPFDMSSSSREHRLTQFTLLPIIPSVSYTYSF